MKDAQDGYSFVYLFGWQEVAVKGQDVVYKDVIEPLESVSVSITKTDKDKVSDYGPAAEARAPARPRAGGGAPQALLLADGEGGGRCRSQDRVRA